MTGATPLFPGPPVLLYDDGCDWCRGWSGWLARRDRHHRLRFAPLSGETARLLLPDGPPPDTLVLVRATPKGVVPETRARALLRALAAPGGAWRLAALAARLPRWLIDPPYRLLARHRRRLGVAAPRCPLPPAGNTGHLP